jgi:hypothetical protein
MLRLEQVRAEVLERIERLDRRLGQVELRILRIEQRTEDTAERLARLHLDVAARLESIRDLVADQLQAQD